jgi:hypothetical protein
MNEGKELEGIESIRAEERMKASKRMTLRKHLRRVEKVKLVTLLHNKQVLAQSFNMKKLNLLLKSIPRNNREVRCRRYDHQHGDTFNFDFTDLRNSVVRHIGES